MTASEDLRGRHFGWQESGGVAVLVEDPVEVGRVVRTSDLRSTYLAEFAGDRVMIQHSIGVLGPMFEIRNTATQAVVAKHRYTREAEMRAVVGERTYALRRTGGVAVWNDGAEDAVSLRASEAFVLMGADPRDAAALLLLGIVMALENSLFEAPAQGR